MPGDGVRGNVNEPSWLAAAGVATGAAEAAVRLSDAARAPAIAAALASGRGPAAPARGWSAVHV